MKKILTGKVVSVQPKTAIVEVRRRIAHPLYKKLLVRTKRFKVDTSKTEVSMGEQVRIVETRQMAKDKYFTIAEKIVDASKKGSK